IMHKTAAVSPAATCAMGNGWKNGNYPVSTPLWYRLNLSNRLPAVSAFITKGGDVAAGAALVHKFLLITVRRCHAMTENFYMLTVTGVGEFFDISFQQIGHLHAG